MLSICVTVKNRSRVQAGARELRLFPNCVRSIAESARGRPDIELVVSDWHSDDWPLEEWLAEAAAPVPTRIVRADGTFSRGRGRNMAANAAAGDSLLFLDADSLLCETVLQRGEHYLAQGKSYFPILYSFKDPAHETGWWRRFGFGNCIVTQAVFQKSGGWPEFTHWGKEDDLFYIQVAQLTPVVREEVEGFFHQWHPDDAEFKDAFSERKEPSPTTAQHEQDELALAKREAAAVLPESASVIFVDEEQWRENFLLGRTLIPFTERDGKYWGPPLDDDAAIAEFERLRSRGAQFLVFASPAVWWFHHYLGWQRHLESRFAKVLHNERLIVFDLRSKS